MPITGFPDPVLHRKCKRCGTWFHLHEGALCWPPKRGLLSLVHVSLAEWTEQRGEMKFYCVACQDLNAHDVRQVRKQLINTGITLLVIMLGLALAQWLELFAWMDLVLRAR